MARRKDAQSNINNSDAVNYPHGRIKNNTGPGDGTPVNEFIYGDIHEFFGKLMRLYGIEYNALPDNEQNGYQLVESVVALASKNDFCLALTTADDILRVPLKIGKLKNDESFILKAAADKTTEINIRGTLDNVSKPVTYLGDFKAGEYVRMVNTENSVVLIRMIDSFNLGSAVSDLGYLTAATLAESLTGAIDTKAETPLSALTTFIDRVNGATSINYLATQLVNGLMSAADKLKLDNLQDLEDSIKFTQGQNVQITNPNAGANENNFNFNYVDVPPPAGMSVSNLKGFTCSIAEFQYSGNVDDNDSIWCKWRIEGSNVRIICGGREFDGFPQVNYLGIWI